MKQEEKSMKLQKAEEQVRIANTRLARVQREEKQKNKKARQLEQIWKTAKRTNGKKNRCF